MNIITLLIVIGIATKAKTRVVSNTSVECDSLYCPRSTNGALCSEHGICECGVCVCDLGYRGLLCENVNSAEHICKTPETQPNSAATCSGHGICVSGKCRCDATYYGKVCDKNIFLDSGEFNSSTAPKTEIDDKLLF